MSTFGDTTQTQTPAGPTGRPPLRRAYNGRMLAGVPAYLACWLLIPEEGSDQSIAGSLFSSVEHGL